MSTRALRRLMHSQTADNAPTSESVENTEPDEGEESGSETESRSHKKKNVFDLLALEDLDIDDAGDMEEDTLNEVTSNKDSLINGKGTNSTGQNRKKKKGKKKKADRVNNDVAENKTDEFDLDSYAKAVAEERRRLHEQEDGEGSKPDGAMAERSILSVDHRWLDADYEMARIFGSSFVRNEASKRVVGRMPGAGLVRPKAQWPMASQLGLSMIKMDVSDDETDSMWFVVEQSKEYRAVNEKFHDALHSHDPNNLQEIFRRQPYHVDTLLQMTDVFRTNEDYDTAADLAERAVFAFTRSAHPLFNVSSGRCLLDYRYDENRGFFVSLFLHIQFLGRRGCYRTGLEFCKVLLSLNPKKDPMAAILLIDHFAIMSGELQFLLRLFREWQTYKNLNQLPNFMFSCALAHLRQRDGVVDNDEADLMLQDALLRFPGWLPMLLRKCEVNPDDRVTKSQFFNHDSVESEGLARLYQLHIGRTYHCWKEPRTLHWLEVNVTAVLDIVEIGDDPRIKEYTDFRSRRYRETPTSVLRHIFLSSIPGVTFSMPSQLQPVTIASYDPLPPKDSISLHPRPVRRRRAELETGFLRPFLNSILPTYDPQEEGQEIPAGVEIRRAEEIIQTIRQLLAGIQPNPPPIANERNLEDAEQE